MHHQVSVRLAQILGMTVIALMVCTQTVSLTRSSDKCVV
jgi:hypothetical protein